MKLYRIIAIAGVATFGAALGVANAAPSGGSTSGSASTSGTSTSASTVTPATPALPATPVTPAGTTQDKPVTINQPGGNDGAGISIKDPNSASNASVNANTQGNSANAHAKGLLDFGMIDKNSDGSLTKAEAISSKNKDLAGAFDKLDANRDGRIDNAEFAKFDVNVNGALPSTPVTTTTDSKLKKK